MSTQPESTHVEVNEWHFPMMNDEVRNAAYETALASSIKEGDIVLDIGAGSGLLSMLAARHGAARVITCEAIPHIARKASEIIKLNGYSDRIEVINKKSTDLVIGQDLPQKADVLVAEIFDDGLLGEEAFKAYRHAVEHLLKPGAKLIPSGVSVKAMCIESYEIFECHRVEKVAGFDLSPFNEFAIYGGYFGYHLDKMDYRPISAAKKIFDFDLRTPPGLESLTVGFEALDEGLCHAIAYWFELRMDDKTILSSAPGLPQLSSWKQAIQIFNTPKKLTKGQTHRLTAYHDDDEIWFSRID